MERINFEVNGYKFDFDLRPPVTVIWGDSSSGKSFFWQMLSLYKSLPENSESCSNIELLNYSSKIETVLTQTGKLFIIDNADALLQDKPDIAEHISVDYGNNYVIMGRCAFNFGVSPNHYAVILEENKVFTLHYEFNVKGWGNV